MTDHVDAADVRKRAGSGANRRRGRKAGSSFGAGMGPDSLPLKALLTTGEAARALSISVQTVRNWVASGRLAGVARGVRTMLPRAVVSAEIERSRLQLRQAAATAAGPPREAAPRPNSTVKDLPRQDRIYEWMERARAEGVHFPLDEYNARIPRDLIEQAQQRAAEVEVPAPWSEHFRPATEADLLALPPAAE